MKSSPTAVRQVREAFIDGYTSALDTRGVPSTTASLLAEKAWRDENTTE